MCISILIFLPFLFFSLIRSSVPDHVIVIDIWKQCSDFNINQKIQCISGTHCEAITENISLCIPNTSKEEKVTATRTLDENSSSLN